MNAPTNTTPPTTSLTTLATLTTLPTTVERHARMAGPAPSPMEVLLPESDVLVDEDRPWAVIVWNDPINLMNYVSYVFRKLFGFSEAKADRLMRDVHEKGRANVATGTRSECERHVHQLHGHGLWATLEHDK